MEFDALLITNGITSLTVSIVSIYTGLKIAFKYFQYKERTLIFAGITWLLMYEGWWAPSISFLSLCITNQTLPLELFYFIAVGLAPVAITLWMMAFTELKYKKLQKPIFIIFLIQTLIFEIFSFYFLLTNPSVIVESVGLIDAQYKSFVIIFFIQIAVILAITGILFAWQSLKINQPEVRLKGLFLLVGFVTFIVGSIFDAFLDLNILTLVLYRSLLIFSSFTFYLGFFLPNWLKRKILRVGKNSN